MKRAIAILLTVMMLFSLCVTASAISSADVSLTDVSVTLDGTNDATADVVFQTNQDVAVVALQGAFSTTETDDTNEYIKLTSFTTPVPFTGLNAANENTGEFIYADDTNFVGYNVAANGSIITAHYTVAAGTPSGQYTVTLTKATLTDATLDPQFTQQTYTATITVTRQQSEYLIGTAEELAAFATEINNGNTEINAKLTADVTVDESFTSIGSSSAKTYQGVFDGDGHTVTLNGTPLFDYASGTIQNVTVTGSVARTSSYTGALVDYLSGGTVENCHNTASVSGTDYVGGLIGYVSGSGITISNSSNRGAVSASSTYAGGLIGYAYGALTVTDCYNSGVVNSATTSIGGLVGFVWGQSETAPISFTNCYSSGAVTTTSSSTSDMGAMLGIPFNAYYAFNNCYYLDAACEYGVNGMGRSTAGTSMPVSKTADELKTAAYGDSDILTLLGVAYCADDAENPVNGGYPVLRGQVGRAVPTTANTVEFLGTPKTEYVAGQTFDPTGVVAKISWADGSVSYSDEYTVSKTAALEVSDTGVTVSMTVGGTEYTQTYNITVTGRGVARITVSTEATAKTLYLPGEEELSKTGLTVTAYYTDFPDTAVTLNEEDYTLSKGADGVSIVVSYTYNGATVTASYAAAFLSTVPADSDHNGAVELASANDLIWFAHQVNSEGKLTLNAEVTADIDLTGTAFTAMGAYNAQYQGVFDGQGHTITLNGYSLFNFANATIRNVITAGVVELKMKLMLFANREQEMDYYTGALVCSLTGGSVENCHNIAAVSGHTYTGGLIGMASGSSTTITNCSNRADVTAVTTTVGGVGGLIGHIAASGGTVTVTNCYNTGDFTAIYNTSGAVGGLTGYAYAAAATDKVIFINCYSTGTVVYSGAPANMKSYVGNFVGRTFNTYYSFINCFYLDTACEDSGANGMGVSAVRGSDLPIEKTEGQLRAITYGDSDVLTLLGIAYCADDATNPVNGGYPVLRGQVGRTVPATATLVEFFGTPANTQYFTGQTFDPTGITIRVTWEDGSVSFVNYDDVDKPVLQDGDTSATVSITTLDGQVYSQTYDVITNPVPTDSDGDGVFELIYASDLLWLADQVNNCKTSPNVKVTENIDLTGVSYMSIGTSSDPYTGSFDGDGHTITLAENSLFDYVGAGAVIKNVTTAGSVSHTTDYTGALVNYLTDGTVENCHNSASVSGTQYVGGLIGYAYGAPTVTGCYNSGTVSSTSNYVGGLVGYAYAYSTGGIQITDCYNSGSVSSKGDSVGGLVGYVRGRTSLRKVTFTNCYNSGAVSTTYTAAINVGAMLGGAYNTYYSFTNCYWLETAYTSDKSTTTTSVTSDQLKTLAPTLGDAFAADTANINSGYPILATQAAGVPEPSAPAYEMYLELSATDDADNDGVYDVDPGETFTATLYVKSGSAQQLSGYDAAISYDSSLTVAVDLGNSKYTNGLVVTDTGAVKLTWCDTTEVVDLEADDPYALAVFNVTVADAGTEGLEYGKAMSIDLTSGTVTDLNQTEKQTANVTGSSVEITTTYTITWDVDGVQTTDTVNYGEMPVYSGETPSKAGYTFEGWKDTNGNEPKAATADVMYTAQWKSLILFVTEDYRYAFENGVLLIVAAPDLEEDKCYQYNGEAMFYTTDANYVSSIENNPYDGVYVYIISADDTDETIEANITVGDGENVTIVRDGNVTANGVVEYDDATTVNVMVIGATKWSSDPQASNYLSIQGRLAADIATATTTGDQRGTIADVAAIITILQGK